MEEGRREGEERREEREGNGRRGENGRMGKEIELVPTLYTRVSFTEEFLSEVVSLVVMGSDKVWPILMLAFQITPVDGSSNRIHGCKSRKANAASISRVRAGQTAASTAGLTSGV